jgi:hypothetical protein
MRETMRDLCSDLDDDIARSHSARRARPSGKPIV